MGRRGYVAFHFLSLQRRERKHGKAERGEGKGGPLPLCPVPSPAADHSPHERGPFVGCSVFWTQEGINAFSEKLWSVPIVPLVQNLRESTCVSPGRRSVARRASPPAPTLPGGARWAQGSGLGKVSAALAALRTGPGWQVLGSGRGGEECSQRGLEPCRSLCWTRPRDRSPVPAALPRGQQSERLPELGLRRGLARPLLHSLQQHTATGGDFHLPEGRPPMGCFPCWDRGVVKHSFIAEMDSRGH